MMVAERRTEIKADMMLLLVTLCWGVSYYGMGIALTELGTFTLNAIRFLGAFAVIGILTFPKLKGVNKKTILYSLVVGFFLLLVYMGDTLGVKYTTLSNAAFLSSVTVVVTPVLEMIIFKRRPPRKIIFAVVLCMVGIMLLTLKSDFSLNMHHLKGDLFSLMAGLAYGFEIIATDKAVNDKEVDPYQLGVFGLGVTGIGMLVLELLIENPAMPHSPGVWAAVIFLSLFCTGLPFVVQPIAQQYTDSSHVGLIYALQPVFAGITAFAMAGEVLPPRGYLGEVMMVSSLFIMEIDFGRLRKRQGKLN